MADSSTGPQVFIIQPPNFAAGVEIALVFQTEILTADDATEQRGRRRTDPKIEIRQTINGARSAIWTAQRFAHMRALTGTAIVPVWTHNLVSDSVAADSADFTGQETIRRKFKMSSYALIEESGIETHFRQVASISDTQLVLEVNGGNAAFPAIASPVFTTSAKIYPCVISVVEGGRQAHTSQRVDRHAAIFNYQEL